MLTVGASLIKVNGGFRRDTTNRRYAADPPTEFPPHLFGTYTTGKWSLGFGAYVPYGLTSEWKDDFPGRFVALRASLKTFYFQPNVAYAINPNWSIGIGPVFGYSKVQLIQAIDLSEQTVPTTPYQFSQLGVPLYTEFGRAQLEGSGTAFGVNVGVHGQLNPGWSVGARYISELKFKYKDADATFSQTPTGLTLAAGNPLGQPAGTPIDALVAGQFAGNGPLTAQKGSSEIPHPWQAQAGVGYTGFAGSTLSFDVERIGWSAFKTLPVSFQGTAAANSRELLEDYHDIWAFRFGAEHVVQEKGMWQGWALRGGYSYAQSPAPDETVSPLLPDMNRNNLSLGVGIPIKAGLTLDASYLHVGTGGRRGRITERTSSSQTAAQLNSGAFDLSAHIVSLSLNASF
jgi:long-chain fatty acid transport protein